MLLMILMVEDAPNLVCQSIDGANLFRVKTCKAGDLIKSTWGMCFRVMLIVRRLPRDL